MAACCGSSKEAKLYTLNFSHYCEAARWALEVAKVEFTEVVYVPGAHMFFSPIAKLRKRGERPKDFTGSAATTPLLMSADGKVVGYDSWACVAKLGNPAPTERVKELLDTVVGPHARSIFCSHMVINDKADRAFRRIQLDPKVPRWQRFLMSRRPFRKQVEASMYADAVKSPEHMETVRAKLREALAELEPLLGHPPYSGPEPTAAGIVLASLMALIIWPPEYSCSFYGRHPLPLAEAPAPLQREVEAWRQTKVGAWSLEYYARHRKQGK